ncbi:hypothetical protein INT44_002264, partial [Umbelopsis vinacea]
MIKTVFLVFSLTLIAAVKAEGCSGSATITSQADLDAIGSCKTYTGSITIDNLNAETLQLKGVETVTGDLLVKNNAALSSFSAPVLQSVKGQLELSNQVHLGTFQAPKLQTVNGLTLSVLPELMDLGFLNTINGLNKLSLTDTRAVNIQNANINGLQQLTLTNNKNLTSIQFPGLMKVDGEIFITANSASCALELPKLTSAKSATFRNLNSFDAAALSEVSQDLSFNQNNMQQLTVDGLKTLGGALIVVDNNQLSKISMNQLTLVGGTFSIGNNSNLLTIDGFPKLEQVHGSVDLSGGFDKVDVPALQDVRGGMRLQTTSSAFQCNGVDNMRVTVIKGTSFDCKSNLAADQLAPTVGQGSSGSQVNSKTAPNQASAATSRLADMQSSLFAFAMFLGYILL